MSKINTSGERAYTLRPYQLEAAQNAVRDISDPKINSTGLVMPTGSGKSLVIIELIEMLRESLSIDGSIIVLCHLSEPLKQLMESYRRFSSRPLKASEWAFQIPSMSYDVIFTTMQKLAMDDNLRKWRNHGKLKCVRRPRYIIIDEAHMYGATSYERILKIFPDIKVIGFTATPFRSNKYSFSQFDRVSFTISMESLIEQGYLTPPELTQVSIPPKYNSDAGRIALALKIWKKKEKERGLVTVVYLPTKQLAKDAYTAFTEERGLRVEYVDSTMNNRTIDRIIRNSRDGKVDVLVNCKVLETGIDIPNIGAVIMPYPVNSVVTYVQRVGRALRLYPGKEKAHIYLCGDTPAIEKGVWEKLHNRALKLRDPLPSEVLLDEMTESGMEKVRMEWTREAIEVCEILEKEGLITLSEFLAYKRYPKKYDKFISDIMKHGPISRHADDSPASDIQKGLLTKKFGFKERQVQNLTKREASKFINGMKMRLSADPHIVRVGNHLGKHMSEVPPLARKYAKGELLYQLRAWWKAGKPSLKKSMDLEIQLGD